MKIELSDHVGKAPDGTHVDHNQWVVFCDGLQVGYLQKTEGAWLQCIVHMGDATKAELIEAVAAESRQRVDGAAVPVDPECLNDDTGEDEDE